MKPSLTKTAWRDPAHLRDCESDNTVLLWWLGQAGFLIEMGNKRIVIDAYLSDSLAKKYAGTQFPHIRMMQAPVQPQDLRDIDLLLCTHAHTDHMDEETIRPLLAANPDCQVIVPKAVQKIALDRGVPHGQMRAIDAFEKLVFDGVTIQATPSAHEKLARSGDGAFEYLGFLIKTEGATVWHSGDTIPYPGLVELLLPHRIDLALLPVNGRDAVRASNGVPGNLTLDEALTLCRQIGVDAMLAHHFGLFEFNTIDPDVEFRRVEDKNLPYKFGFCETDVKYAFQPRGTRENLKILMVCHGNICRSPIAQGVLEARCRDDVIVDSAAVMDWNVGQSPDARAVKIARENGIDIGQQVARQITEADFSSFDVIFGMDRMNMDALHQLKPKAASAQIGLLGNIVELGVEGQIIDPYHMNEIDFRKCFKALIDAIEII